MELRDKAGNVVMKAPDDAEVLDLGRLPVTLEREKLREGLRCLKRLKSLHLMTSELQLKDELEVLRELTWISELGISSLYNGQDLSPIATCRGLRVLRLVGLYKADVTPLASLTFLEGLVLNGDAKNLKALGVLTGLQALELSDNPKVSLKPFARLRHLRSLGLQRSKVSDWQGLAAFPELRMLDLRSTSIESLEELPGLEWLEELRLDGCRKLRSLKGIERFPHLRTLSAQELSSLDSLQPLGVLRDMQRLYLRDTPIEDEQVSMLTQLKSLREVGLTRTSRMGLTEVSRRLPSCSFTIFGRDPQVEVQGAVSILRSSSSEPILYRIDQDLANLLELEDNGTVEEYVEQELSRRFPEARSTVEFDSEGDRFVARATSLEALRSVARIINERAGHKLP